MISLPEIKVVKEVAEGPKSCKACGRGFAPSGRGIHYYCGGCETWFECLNCSEPFQLIKLTRPRSFCTNKCQRNYTNRSVICETHGLQEVSFNGACLKCHHGPIYCETHGEQDSSLAGHCVFCKAAELHISIVCEIHGPQETSLGGHCRECKPGNRFLASFVDGNCCSEHEFEKKAALRGDKYECWSCIKEQPAFSLSFALPESIRQLTYRVSSSSIEGQFLMEQELVERGVEWFVYIKLYLEGSESYPLVAGKTGSKLVNSGGTDVRFRYNKGTAAQSFLLEKNLQWDTSQILIIPCESEAEALATEAQLAINYNLFHS